MGQEVMGAFARKTGMCLRAREERWMFTKSWTESWQHWTTLTVWDLHINENFIMKIVPIIDSTFLEISRSKPYFSKWRSWKVSSPITNYVITHAQGSNKQTFSTGLRATMFHHFWGNWNHGLTPCMKTKKYLDKKYHDIYFVKKNICKSIHIIYDKNPTYCKAAPYQWWVLATNFMYLATVTPSRTLNGRFSMPQLGMKLSGSLGLAKDPLVRSFHS